MNPCQASLWAHDCSFRDSKWNNHDSPRTVRSQISPELSCVTFTSDRGNGATEKVRHCYVLVLVSHFVVTHPTSNGRGISAGGTRRARPPLQQLIAPFTIPCSQHPIMWRWSSLLMTLCSARTQLQQHCRWSTDWRQPSAVSRLAMRWPRAARDCGHRC